eukprot:CAMPEP_0178762036 /NCGR_PEP_ID=MMETSP0744-20121128/16323_1 /TAXON_ID=913974 /ORGANISM="Nitzschia punctata, Strain CCMP561" /LENGTH=245 /DNA_ID=CAMNT_0020416677 /DNA_START=315 /DNA_END=1052 /DNA_ORIENTATION=-
MSGDSDHERTMEKPPPSTMRERYEQLTEKLRPHLDLDASQSGSSTTFWVGVAGGPGSGKSTVAKEVADRLNQIRQDSAIVIPMDGWHIPQEDLIAAHGEEAMMKRGQHWTFDLDLMHKQLAEAKEKGEASLPIYSREISDPVPNGVKFEPHHKIVFVEGIYVLWKEKYPDLFSLWDDRWFVQCPSRQEQIDRLVNRSIKTWTEKKAKQWGQGLEGARKRVEVNDVTNMDAIKHCNQYADEIIVTV